MREGQYDPPHRLTVREASLRYNGLSKQAHQGLESRTEWLKSPTLAAGL